MHDTISLNLVDIDPEKQYSKPSRFRRKPKVQSSFENIVTVMTL